MLDRDSKGRFIKGHTVRNIITTEVKLKISSTLKDYYSGLSEEDRKKYGQSNIGNKYRLGKTFTEEVKNNISNKLKGRKIPEEIIAKIIKSKSGEKSHFWKGGISPKSKLIRRSFDYRKWREAVFERDNWTCQKTGIKGCNLHPHHILNFAQFPELQLDINNGITLSKESHNQFHEKFGRTNNNLQQLQIFLKGV